jgi:hypothetical protein
LKGHGFSHAANRPPMRIGLCWQHRRFQGRD